MAQMQNFILVYNHASQELEQTLDFKSDVVAATREYARLEAQYRESARMDIVLVGSDSLETVKITHATYFPGESQKRVEDVFRALSYA